MEPNAFTGGVEPGGLWNQNDIRILLCVILKNAGGTFTRQDLGEITQSRGLANFFEVGDALTALERQGNVTADPQGRFRLTPPGEEIARTLGTELPLSVREKALGAAMQLAARDRALRENRVEITEEAKGFRVRCRVCDGDLDLLTVSLYAPDRAQAQVLEAHFYANPEGLYRLVLAALTGEKTFLDPSGN